MPDIGEDDGMTDPYSGQSHRYFDNSGDDIDDEGLTQYEREGEGEEGYYALLNVPRNATLEQIRESYRRISRKLHPDKHLEQKDLAEKLFQKLSIAYEVLSDPQKRMIYDSFGAEGLQTKWELGPLNQTPDQLREHILKLIQKQREEQIEQLVRAKGDIQLTIDGTSLFAPIVVTRVGLSGKRVHPTIWQRLALCSSSQYLLRHSFSLPVVGITLPLIRNKLNIDPATTQLTLNAHLNSRGGNAIGNIIASFRYAYSADTLAELNIPVLSPRTIFFKGVTRIDKSSILEAQVQQKWGFAPVITFATSRQLTKQGNAFLSFRTGNTYLPNLDGNEASSYTVGWNHTSGNTESNEQPSEWSIQTTASPVQSSVAGQYSKSFGKGEESIRVRMDAQFSNIAGLNFSLSATKKVTDNVTMTVGYGVGVPNGSLTLRITFKRLGQRIILPILLSGQYNTKALLYGCVLPISGLVAYEITVARPKLREARKNKIKILRQENTESLELSKKEAENAIELLKGDIIRKQANAESRGGLVIVKAEYGCFRTKETIDVTLALASLIFDDQLIISGGYSKAGLQGFWDCALGEHKKLFVKYKFDNLMHEVEVGNRESLEIPYRGHRI